MRGFFLWGFDLRLNYLAEKYKFGNVHYEFLNVAEDLLDEISKNPKLKVYVRADIMISPLRISFLNDVTYMFLRPEQKKNIQFRFYESGHTYYINKHH